MEKINRQRILPKRKNKRKLVRVVVVIFSLMLVWKILGNTVTWVRQWQSDKIYDVLAGNMSVHDETVGTPQKYSTAQITSELSRLSKKNQTYKSIYDNQEKYPTVLLRSLCNNSEMLDFVAGYLTADKSAHGQLTAKECKERIPLLMQWDKRWGYVSYGSSDIGLSGCAPTCLSMVIVGLTSNRNATPDKIAEFAQENGYYLKGIGTSWSLLTKGASHFGIEGREISLSKKTIESALQQGQPVICSVGPGEFTTEGHFIVLTGMKQGKIKVNDPNCIRRSCLWDYEVLEPQIKNLWAYSQ